MSSASGCYGFRLEGIDAASLLVAAPAEWPAMHVGQALGAGSPPELDFVGPRHGGIVLQTGGWIELQREPARMTFHLPGRRPDGEIVHPYLAPGMSVAARWAGRETFHASAVVIAGSAWLLVGDKGDGKSSTVAWLATRGHPVLTDDLVVVDGAEAFAGPRCLDLRPDAAEQLGAGEPLGLIGGRERWRLALDPVPPRVPLGGWFRLGWGDAVEATPIPAAQRLLALAGARSLRVPPERPEALVGLSALPGWGLRRPREWRSIPEVAARMLEIAAT